MNKAHSEIERVKIAFEEMQTKKDFLKLMNLAKPMVFGKKAVPFNLNQLMWYANPEWSGKRYRDFKIPKKSGEMRNIHAPVRGLKAIQQTLSFILQCVFEPHKAATGFVWKKSVVDNAKVHIGQRYVYNIDLKDFFQTIDQARVWKCFQLMPFNLVRSDYSETGLMRCEDLEKKLAERKEEVVWKEVQTGLRANTSFGVFYASHSFDFNKEIFVYFKGVESSGKGDYKTLSNENFVVVNKIQKNDRLNIANIITGLCCTEMKVERKTESGDWVSVQRKVLPQGAPTSPVITNIICKRLDILLTGVANRFGLRYSRYADDITFSSMHNVYQTKGKFLKEVDRIISGQGFSIKESKSRLQKDGYRKEVTGLVVSEGVNVQRRYIKQLRMWLYYWERYGYERASELLLPSYICDKSIMKRGQPLLRVVIRGKLDYLKMVKGTENVLYSKLKSRFEILDFTLQAERENHLNTVIDRFIKDGMNDAMDLYVPINL